MPGGGAGGRLFTADLCANVRDPSFGALMDLWVAQAGMPDERKAMLRDVFGKAVAAHGPAEVEAIVTRAGFSAPVQCGQAALIRAWAATRL